MNDGRKVEKLVRLIQEAIKDFPNVEIFSNYEIKNKSGRKREIDVLLKTTVNSFEIIIAIECKDYKNAVPVEKIEAFNSKMKLFYISLYNKYLASRKSRIGNDLETSEILWTA